MVIFNSGYLIGRGTRGCHGTHLSTGVFFLKFELFLFIVKELTFAQAFNERNSLIAVTFTI